MADIFKEVEEDLRRDNAAALWKKYGRYLVGLAVAVVLAVAGAQAWRAYDEQRRGELSDKYAVAVELSEDGETEAALQGLSALAAEGRGGYEGLAAFEEARLLAESGDVGGAIAAWDRIAAESSLGPAFQGVAALLSIFHQLDDGDPAELRARLEPLSAAGKPFRASALELSALLALREGDAATARELYSAISDDPDAPGGIRARAAQMLAALKE